MADIKIIINGDPSGGVSALRTIRRELDATRASAEGASSGLRRIGETALGFASAQAAISLVGKTFDTVKSSLIDFNSRMENAGIAFETMLGSAQAAQSLLSELAAFARQTPFEFPELVTSSQRLLAFGFAAKDIIPIMTAIGDATSAMGAISAESLRRVTIAIGQIGTRGKVSTEELLQLAEAGIPAFRILADGLGVTTGQLQKMLEQGLIPADRGLKILLEGMEQRAPGAMQRMATTWTGATSNIKDSVSQLLAGAFKPLYDQLVAGANALANFLQSDRVIRFAKDVNEAMAALTGGIRAAFTGDDAKADRLFDQFGQAVGRAAQQIELLLLRVADVMSPLAGLLTEGFANLAQAAVGWGANLISSFTVGLVTAAGSILADAMNSIMSFIAGWFPASPAKRGPFQRVYDMGADLLNSLFAGMSMADFSALDTVMASVKDVLDAAFANNADADETGLIPRLLGSQAGVAQALADLRQFGDIASSTLDLLNANLGDASATIVGLIRNVADLAAKDAEIARLQSAIDEWEQSIRAVDVEINKIKRQMDDLRRRYDEQRRPIEDAIALTERYYGGLIRNADAAIRKIEDQIRAQERLRRPMFDALDTEERGLNLSVAQQELADAQNAHVVRRAQLEQDVRSAQNAVNSARDPVARAEAMMRLAEAQQRLASEGVQTDRDRLAIVQARRRVAEAQLAIETAGARAELRNAQEERDRLVTERDTILEDKKSELEAINDEERARLRLLEDQLGPLQQQRQHAQDQKDALDDQVRLLEAQRKPIQDAIDLVQTRLSHEADVAGQLDRQLDLLNQIATAASGGGAGRVGAGLGAALNPNIGAGLGLNIPRFQNPNDPNVSPVGGDPIGQPNIDDTLRALREKVKNEFKAAIKEGFEQGFGDWERWDIAWTVIGAGIGAKLGGPIGAGIGASIGKGFSDWLQGAGNELGKLSHRLLNAIFGDNRFASETVGDRIKDIFDPVFDPERWAEFGGWIVKGLWNGIEAAWNGLLNFLSGLYEGFVGGFKSFFRLGSPSKLFEEYGGDLVQGLWNGVEALWNRFTGWVSDQWDNLIGGIEKRLGIDGESSSVFDRIGTVIMKGLQKGVEAVWNETIKPWLEDLPEKIKTAIGDLAETLKDKGNKLLDGFWEGMKQKWSDATGGPLTWLNKRGNDAATAIGDVTRSLYQSGWDLLNGMWEGMKGVWNQIASWLSGIATSAANALNPRNLVPGIPKMNKGGTNNVGLGAGKDVDEAEEYDVKHPPSTGMRWEPGPNGTQIAWTGPQTYWIRYADGRVEQHSTLEPDHPLKAMTGNSPTAFAPPPAGGGGGGEWRGPVSHNYSQQGMSQTTTNNFGGIVGLLQEIVQDEFGTFTSYSATLPGVERIIGPIADLVRRFGSDLSRMPQELKDALNQLIMDYESSRNPASPNYNPANDPNRVFEPATTGLADAGTTLDQAGKDLSAAADDLRRGAVSEDGPRPDNDRNLDVMDAERERLERERRERERRERERQQGEGGTDGRAAGGPLPGDGWFFGHAGEHIVTAASAAAYGGGAPGGGGPVFIIQNLYGFDDFRKAVREATGQDLRGTF